MKHIFIFLFMTLSFSFCSSSNSSTNDFIGKSYSHTYLHYSAMNEYGKGGGSYRLTLTFDKDNVSLFSIARAAYATESRKYTHKSDSINIFTSSYSVNSGEIIIDHEILPKLILKNDTLIAPILNWSEMKPDISKDIIFKYEPKP